MWEGDQEMKKLFISQPMNGRTDEEILKERKEVIKKAESMIGEPVEVIDSFFRDCSRECYASVVSGKITGIAVHGRCGIFCRGLAGGQRVQDRA